MSSTTTMTDEQYAMQLQAQEMGHRFVVGDYTATARDCPLFLLEPRAAANSRLFIPSTCTTRVRLPPYHHPICSEIPMAGPLNLTPMEAQAVAMEVSQQVTMDVTVPEGLAEGDDIEVHACAACACARAHAYSRSCVCFGVCGCGTSSLLCPLPSSLLPLPPPLPSFLLFQVQAPAPDGRRFKTKVPANCTVGSVFQVPVPPTPAAATPTAAAVATPAARGMTPVTAVPMTQGPISVGSVGTVGALGLRQPR